MRHGQVDLPPTEGFESEDAKQVLRDAVRAHRNRRPEAERVRAGEALVEAALAAVGDAARVACYVSRSSEPRTGALLEALRRRGTEVLLPVLGPGLNREWAPYTDAEDLEVRAPGRPPEPSGPPMPAEAVAGVDVVIAPALAVDAAGARLGQGGGWYDRVLKIVPPDMPVFAVVHDDELVVDRLLPVDRHDVPVPAVITPGGWFLIKGSPFEAAAQAANPAGVVGR